MRGLCALPKCGWRSIDLGLDIERCHQLVNCHAIHTHREIYQLTIGSDSVDSLTLSQQIELALLTDWDEVWL